MAGAEEEPGTGQAGEVWEEGVYEKLVRPECKTLKAFVKTFVFPKGQGKRLVGFDQGDWQICFCFPGTPLVVECRTIVESEGRSWTRLLRSSQGTEDGDPDHGGHGGRGQRRSVAGNAWKVEPIGFVG